MTRLTVYLVPVLLFLFVWLTPDLSFAQEGLITCSGTECSACNLVELINNMIVWLFGIIFMIFTVLMVIAGFGLVTSGGSQSALQAAKSKFTNAIIGLIIVMGAWLLVDTIMKGVVGGGDTGAAVGEIKGWGPWSQVKCMDQSDTIAFVDLNTGNTGNPNTTGNTGGGTVTPPNTGTGSGQDPNSTVQGACKVPALTVITDELALSMERGASVIYNNANLEKCAKKFVGLVGGRVNSAYRPASYQNHLWEIKDRWCTKGLRSNSEAACSSLKSAVSSEVNKHFGSGWSCGAVGATSRHSQGAAVDIGGISNHTAANVKTAAAASCLVWKNYPGDPVHYDLISGCTCN